MPISTALLSGSVIVPGTEVDGKTVAEAVPWEVEPVRLSVNAFETPE
jgi:hypothetical protein